jgi:hypothetical protein
VGGVALTGGQDGPPLAPPTTAAVQADRAAGRFGLDAEVLAERAAVGALRRRGQTSCGGAARLLRAADGWLALSLPQAEDVTALPARSWPGPMPCRRVQPAAHGGEDSDAPSGDGDADDRDVEADREDVALDSALGEEFQGGRQTDSAGDDELCTWRAAAASTRCSSNVSSRAGPSGSFRAR